ncbi:MAG TPA: hypothetical protein VF786_08750 [Terriglobales bacterium]
MRSLRCALAFAVLIFAAGALAAQADYHLTDDSAHSVYQHSSWAHGYVHGYQMGFHEGTIDYHMAHIRRDPRKIKSGHHPNEFYRDEFGDRRVFDSGFKEGFKVGYSDAFAGRDYRASNEMDKLAEESQTSAETHLDPVLGEGYTAGQRSGLDDGRKAAAYMPQKAQCPLHYAPPQCAGFRLGFQLGYSDGYHNQREPEEIRNAMNRH